MCFLALMEFERRPVDTVALEGHKVEIPCLVKSRSDSAQTHIVVIVWEMKENPEVRTNTFPLSTFYITALLDRNNDLKDILAELRI